MSTREEYLNTIKKNTTKPVPYFFCLCKAVQRKFVNKYGNIDYKQYYNIPFREIFLRPTRLNVLERFDKYLSSRTIEGTITEWGIELKKSSVEHFTHMIGPLTDATRIEEINELPLPDFLEQYRWDGVKEEISALKEKDLITMCGIYGGNETGDNALTVPAFMDIFESSWYLRGLDNMLMDFYEDEDFLVALFHLKHLSTYDTGVFLNR